MSERPGNVYRLHRNRNRWLDNYDEVPEPPAVFIVSRDTDRRGLWLRLDRDIEIDRLRDTLIRRLGAFAVDRDAWEVFDQIGLGDRMLDPDTTLPDLRDEAARQAAMALHPSRYQPR